jgi:hypothetical protein
MIHTICFFNYWHNGDVYAGKGYMQDIIRQMPTVKFQHAQLNSLKTMSDLNCEHIHTDNINPGVTNGVRYVDFEGVLYINTWVGAYGSAVIPAGQQHANWPSLYTMWMHIYDLIDQVFDVKLARTENLAHYIPTTDWAQFDVATANRFLGQHQNIALMCNGLVRSTQSNLGAMDDVIIPLANEYPDINFVCTSKFDMSGHDVSNIHFTDDIFADVQGGDINEIAYLSTRAFLIMGKNSGPFMFTHIQENVLDPNKIFMSMSHRSSDSYAWGISGLGCRYYHYSGDDAPNAAGVLREAIKNRNVLGPGAIEEVGI